MFAKCADRVDHVFLANAFHGVPDKRVLRARVLMFSSRGVFAIVNWPLATRGNRF